MNDTLRKLRIREGKIKRLALKAQFVNALINAGNVVKVEYAFHPERRWRFDVLLPDKSIGIEIEGLGGRHQSVSGFQQDIEKYNEALILGYSVLRVTYRQLENGDALDYVHRLNIPVLSLTGQENSTDLKILMNHYEQIVS